VKNLKSSYIPLRSRRTPLVFRNTMLGIPFRKAAVLALEPAAGAGRRSYSVVDIVAPMRSLFPEVPPELKVKTANAIFESQRNAEKELAALQQKADAANKKVRKLLEKNRTAELSIIKLKAELAQARIKAEHYQKALNPHGFVLPRDALIKSWRC
jgi:hypothetical protein